MKMDDVVRRYFVVSSCSTDMERLEYMTQFHKAMIERTEELYDRIEITLVTDQIVFELKQSSSTLAEIEEINIRIIGCLLASYPFTSDKDTRCRDRILRELCSLLSISNSKHTNTLILVTFYLFSYLITTTNDYYYYYSGVSLRIDHYHQCQRNYTVHSL